MPTNREIFFSLLKENNKYFKRLVIKSLLNNANGFTNEIDLYKNFDIECPNYENLLKDIDRVRNGEPYQYVLGKANFIDWFFEVNRNVLIPRQETEELVIDTKQLIEKFLKKSDLTIVDVGTGSGCIAVTMKRYFPKSKVFAIDIDEKCLEIANKNAQKHGQNVEFVLGNLIDPIVSKNVQVDVLISNPPYICDVSTIDEQVYKYEPHLALLANPHEKFYEEIMKNAKKIMAPNFLMAFEIGEDMEDKLSLLVEKYFPTAAYKISKDMYGKTRFLFIIKKEDMNYA